MITFIGKIYNVTSGVEREYGEMTIAQYVGTADMGNWYDADFNSTRARFSINAANNIGRVIEQEAKLYYSRNLVYPVLRIYIADKDSFYFEWNHESRNTLALVTSDRRVLTNILHFEDQTSWDSGIYSYVWSTASTVSELADYPRTSYFGWIYFGIPYVEVVNSSPCSGHVTNTHYTLTYDSSYAAYVDSSSVVLVRSNAISEPSQPHSQKLRYNLPSLASGIVEYYEQTVRVGTQTFYPAGKSDDNGELVSNSSSLSPATYYFIYMYNNKPWGSWRSLTRYDNVTLSDVDYSFAITHFAVDQSLDRDATLERILRDSHADYDTDVFNIYQILTAEYQQVEPPSDVDPDEPDAPTPQPSPPDEPDPYYDPESDPESPDYDSTKDPTSSDYDPTIPHTPYRPPSTISITINYPQPPQNPIPAPVTPPSYVTTNDMFTLYNPSGGDLTNIASFLWSPAWSVDTLKKIFANPLDCILGLLVMPRLQASTNTKVMAIGNISTGISLHYFTQQFFDFDCGSFDIKEYYSSYLDYAPYTRINIFLPYIGDQRLNTDEVMNKTINVKYRFDLATGDCVAFIIVDSSVLYSFSGNCAARLPIGGNNWSGLIPSLTTAAIRAGSVTAGVPALGVASALAVTSMKQDISHTGAMSGSAGLMGVQTPYVIISRPRQALPYSQNSYTGYPSFITENLGSLSGYTEVESCHLENVPCTSDELIEIERLLKEGVYF